MAKKILKLVVLVLFVSLITSTAVGCASQPSSGKSAAPADNGLTGEFAALKALYPGDMSNRMEEFLGNEFKDLLKKNLNMSLEVMYVPWDQYWDKKDMMLAANEQMDWYWDCFPNLYQMTAKKQNIPLDDMLTYLPDLLKVIPMENIKAATVNGKIMGIPSTNCPNSGMWEFIVVRQDMLEKVGMKEIKTTADLKAFGEKVKAKYPDMNAGAHPVVQALTREFADQGYIFVTDSYMLCAGQKDSKVYSYYETEAFKNVAKYNRDLYLNKLYTDDVTIKLNEGDARLNTGTYLWSDGSVGKNMELIQELKKNVPDAKLETYIIAPEKPMYIPSPGGEIISVSPSSKYPERVMMFLNWIFKSQDNYLTTIYGVKGKDYEIVNGRLKLLTNDTFFYEWMFRNVNYQLYSEDISDAYIEKYKNLAKDPKYANTFGFVFDSSPVKTEEARIREVIGKQLTPVSTGFVDFEQNYEKAIQALKTAGIDKYREECQKQLDVFLAGKK